MLDFRKNEMLKLYAAIVKYDTEYVIHEINDVYTRLPAPTQHNPTLLVLPSGIYVYIYIYKPVTLKAWIN